MTCSIATPIEKSPASTAATEEEFRVAESTISQNWKPTGSMLSLASLQSAASMPAANFVRGGRIESNENPSDAEAAPVSRLVVYALFALFVGINMAAGIVSNNSSKTDGKERWGAMTNKYLEFSLAVAGVLDAVFRIAVAYPVMKYLNMGVSDCFQGITSGQIMKTVLARFWVQASEILGVMAMVYLTASTANVIKQAQIPLVGLCRYVLLKKGLSRDQTIYAVAIIPLAMMFCLLGAEGGENHIL